MYHLYWSTADFSIAAQQPTVPTATTAQSTTTLDEQLPQPKLGRYSYVVCESVIKARYALHIMHITYNVHLAFLCRHP